MEQLYLLTPYIRKRDTNGSVSYGVPGCNNCTHSLNGKACRRWVNCPTYNDKDKQLNRLKNKEQNINIQQWYNDSFRQEAIMHDLYING